MSKKEVVMSISCVENIKFSSTVSTSSETFPAVVAWLADGGHMISDDKESVPAFNFSRYESTRRKQHLVVDVSAAVLDLDDLNEAQVTKIRGVICQFKSVCYSTYSHTASKPKVRLLVPFRDRVSPVRYRDYVRRLAQMLDVQYDRVSENPNSIYYLPSRPDTPSEDHFIDAHLDPDFLDFDALPAAKARVSANSSSDDDSDERNYYDLAADAQDCMFPDGLVFVNSEFYAYADGVWGQSPVLSMKKALSRKDSPLHDILASPSVMNNLFDGLRAHAHLDAFPEPAPMTVCVLNGVVDLLTGKLRQHTPSDWHRNALEIEYRDDAKCPCWTKFVEDVFSPDKDKLEKAAFLQEFVGYLLTPSSKHQLMLLCVGEGANGKSVAVEIMQALLGTSNYSTVPLHQLGQAFRNAVLQSKLANFCSEISGTRRPDEGAIKEIVGGDAIYAEKKGKDGFSFKPYARIVATGNTLPELSDTSDGFSRRLAILTFNRRFAEHERDHDLQNKLLAELPGIFVWALEGLKRLREAGKFTRVPSSTEAVAAYKLRSNPVAQFMTTMADKSTGRERTKSSDLYKAFHQFCQDNGFVPVMSNARFGIELSRMDIKSKKSNGSLYYPIKLRPAELPTRPTRSSTLADEIGSFEDEAA
ncbi:DNA primase family protein [Paraburkholderia tropica]|uniref:DNA primase family protein n=1 Tax=Paraburkholderia tropica TaxID=92647 RepID=UPI002ABE931F|nr:phage/plasmid primase, P4 family [Paraburkholderia tropica]